MKRVHEAMSMQTENVGARVPTHRRKSPPDRLVVGISSPLLYYCLPQCKLYSRHPQQTGLIETELVKVDALAIDLCTGVLFSLSRRESRREKVPKKPDCNDKHT
jgi:hypothetical protein